jgi:RNA polymerase sigma-70 factor (ECF subfamily)
MTTQAKPDFQLSEKEQERFNKLMKQSYRKVYNMAFRLAGNRSDAEDLTQDSFYRAYRSFNNYEGDRPFENWIFRIVTRLFLDLLRNRRRRVSAVSYDNSLQKRDGSRDGDDDLYFDMPDDAPNPEQKVLTGHFSEDLQKAFDTLTPEQTLLVTLADIENVPYKDIADMLEKPIGTVRSRIHRTHKLLRARMTGQAIAKQAKPKNSSTKSRLEI